MQATLVALPAFLASMELPAVLALAHAKVDAVRCMMAMLSTVFAGNVLMLLVCFGRSYVTG